ncbi:MAG: hypothetical protein KAI72_10030 [Candidatus Pacebacteria bacterium]|nr:hypothetical protein [Candidatus Paceibacterota bacterium]
MDLISLISCLINVETTNCGLATTLLVFWAVIAISVYVALGEGESKNERFIMSIFWPFFAVFLLAALVASTHS